VLRCQLVNNWFKEENFKYFFPILDLGVSVVQGYGLTETTAGGTAMEESDISVGRTGGPTTINQIRLVNWEEGNYRVTNKPYPQGEILIGGENVAMGYYKRPEQNDESFFIDGHGRRWFRTGDIGEVHEDGSVKIIGEDFN
jgi:long-chain acyl-CoA synthetase